MSTQHADNHKPRGIWIKRMEGRKKEGGTHPSENSPRAAVVFTDATCCIRREGVMIGEISPVGRVDFSGGTIKQLM